MGYKIIMNQGHPELTYEQDLTIATDVALSILVEQGAWFLDTTFGMPALPKKDTDQNLALIPGRCKQATKWLIDAGKAKSIEAIAERDNDTQGQVDIRVDATQANDQPVQFETFVPVV
jgi:phage gp46-like protein